MEKNPNNSSDKGKRQKPKPEDGKKKSPLFNYAKYSGIAFQMLAIILLGTYGGVKLDDYFKMKHPVFAAICAILSVIIAMYYVIRDFL